MKTQHDSSFILHHSALTVACLCLFFLPDRALAQAGWGTALSFDGVDDYVQSRQDVVLSNRSFSVEAWVQRRSSNTMDLVVSQGGGAYNQCLMFGFHYFAGNQFVFDFYGNGVGTGTADVDGAWHHWAGTYDASTKVRCLYRDGVLMSCDTNTADHYQGSGPLKIGIGPGGEAPNEFDGSIDEVRIWGVARSPAEIAANMKSRLTGAEAGLMAYWRFDEATGTTAGDATINHLDSDLFNGPSWIPSTVPQSPVGWGLALSTDGTDDYVSTTIPALGSNYTVSAWVNLRGGGSYWGTRVGILSATPCNGSAELLVHNRSDSSAPQYLWLGRCGAYDGTNSTVTVPSNQWVHVAVTVSSNKQVSYFINGSPAGTWNGSALNLTIGPNITLGDNSVRRFDGQLDEVRIWSRARTQAEIAADLSHPLTGMEPDLEAYYRFDEAGGIAAGDASPHRRNGTLNNRPVRVPSSVPPVPLFTLFGANPLTNEFHVPFVDPGATAGAGPVSLAAHDHHLALNADGSVIGWGADYYGQSTIPASATGGVAAIAVGGFHSLALRTNGSVFAWGHNGDGQTNIPASASSGVVAIAAGFSHNLALKTNGSVVAWGWNGYAQTNIPASASIGVVAIAAGGASSLALKTNGSVVVWGWSGQTNLPAAVSSGVVAIASGGSHSLALKTNGAVVAWGDNYYGQTNVPPSATNGVVAISAGFGHVLALKDDGSVVAWGFNDYGQTDIPPSATSGVVAIEAGRYHSLAIKADGSVVAWGFLTAGANAIPPINRTLCPGLATNGTVNVEVPGTYAVTYRVTNALGIVGAATRTVVVVPDTTPPSLPVELVLNAPANACEIPLPVISATDTSDPAPTVTCVPPVGSLLRLGCTNVVCIATDASGNSRTSTIPVLVLGSAQRLAPAGEFWTLRQVQRRPLAVASSSDGTRLVAVEWGGLIYTSTDAGVNWTPRESNRYWRSVASSADGTRLVAADYYGEGTGGRIYTSTDAGVTWTPHGTNQYWGPVASSADGSKLVALVVDGQIFTSADSGTNWIATSAPSNSWTSVASSADGTKLVAADQSGACYTSGDAGLTWVERRVSWTALVALASSADGVKLAAVLEEVGLLTSTNSGVDWTECPVSGTFRSIASSADGSKLVAMGGGGPACFSADSGATWTVGESTANWCSIASSADGNRLVAGTYDGQIQTSVPVVLPPPAPPVFVGATNRVVDLAGLAGTVVTFSVTAANNCADLPVTCTPPSGSTFPAGTNLVTCIAVDAYGLTTTVTFTVAVRGTQPPTDIALSNATLLENQPPGTPVGVLSASDRERGDRHSYTLVSGPGDTDNEWFSIAGNLLQTTGVLSYEFKNSYHIRVRATDSGDLSAEKVFNVTVTDLNDAPVLDVARTPALGFIRIGAGAPAGAVGTPITSLVDLHGPLSNVADDDAAAMTGVAIIGADVDHGAWFYTLDGGTNWASLGAPSESGALLLSAAAISRVYFQPYTNFVGTVPAALSFRAWDRTTGQNGGTADTTSNGWTTAFSTAAASADQPVNWGWAVRLDGANDHVVLPPGMWFSNDLTIEAWVFERSYNNFSRVVDFGNGEYADNVVLALSSGTTGRPYFEVDKGGVSYGLPSPAVVPTNRWVHLAATLQGSNATLYINGAVVATAKLPQPNPVTRTRNYIGRSNWGANSYANAAFDELRIWNVARSQTQITNTMLTTLAGDEPGLVAYYRFDEGAGLLAQDATINHLDGRLTNGPVWVRSTIPVSLVPMETIVGNTRYIQGYWPGGVTRNATPTIPNLVVGGLSDDIAPSSGTSGVSFWNQGANGANGSSRYAVGENAWSGSAGSPVSVTFDGGDHRMSTVGPNAHGVAALSLGGSGGRGGDGWGVITGAGIGGRGGMGGSGGAVTVKSSGDVATVDGNSQGLFALSLAGKGGNGGNGTIWAGIGVSYGGDAGRGGSGGAVQVSGSGEITNSGHNANAVLAVSQGGKGGTGGSGSSIGSGGDGGAGGTGGNVIISGSWAITTRGTNAHGISANSLGGSGGTSGSGGWISGGSGTGGASGDGGQAKVDFGPGTGGEGGTIETFGKDSHGIFAQSVGGFAGKGADAGSVFSASGGDGGSAGNGGSASIVNRGVVTTHGQGAHALFAESIGGGGGSSGSGSGLFGGGSGDSRAGGAGGVVGVFNSGEARTTGTDARGIFAQSVGGSGGNAGLTAAGFTSIGGSGGLGGKGNAVNVTNTGLVATGGRDATAIFAQSVGGGGGTGGGSGAVGAWGSAAIGGKGGGGGDGARVAVSNSALGSITTGGDRSHGIFAQSVGGGGGSGGFALSGSAGAGGSAAAAIGGKGGAGGSANSVEVNTQGAITTAGTNAHAIFAQSVGGGGGSGGFAISVSGSDGVAAALTVGGSGNTGGNGSSVSVNAGGEIETSGNRSYGILAQSVGGGGGDGGFSISGAVAGGATVPLSLGGSGAGGGLGGNVAVTSQSEITTEGRDAHGIFAQSVGGGGGSGGFSISGSVSGGAAVGAAFGGSAGGGAQAGNVSVNTSNTITTAGEHAYGILAQSIGGGGGDGGFSVAAGISSGPTVSLGMGGSGGSGGVAGSVNIATASSINTTGTNAHGIFAQSVGGGGGSGGFSVAGGISSGAAVSAAIGGKGGVGANASTVSVSTTGAAIQTDGDRSYGVLAQSVGGGGGDGGFSVAGGISSGPSVSLGLGGAGGLAGNGASVTVTNRSAISTEGDNAHGIFAQSVGGGGGSGGFSVAGNVSGSTAVGAAMGGGAGGGGSAGDVVVATTNSISTDGNRSYGILVQSVGGGGGDGGFSVAGGIANGTTVNLAMGGKGGTGGVAGNVNLAAAGSITTTGANSHAIFAQSVGGGGGSGGFSVAAGISSGTTVSAGIGGAGGTGANARNVTVTTGTGQTIETQGDRSYGLLAQSVGGGGGDGGFSVAGGISQGPSVNFGMGGAGGVAGDGATVTVTNRSTIETHGLDSHGIFVQSVGGGGGSGGFSVAGGISSEAAVSASIGGSGNNGGRAGNVILNSSGGISTSGDHAYGILAQSVGGGGGDGGFSVAGGISKGPSVTFGLGGGGGAGGAAGTVVVDTSSGITTTGTNAHGILAQSVGGGGGSGGFSVAGGLSLKGALSAALGGKGGSGSSASNVNVTSRGIINTSGDHSYGILAQSVGGGGGDGGFSFAGAVAKGPALAFALGGSGSTGGVGRAVSVLNEGAITTHGTVGHGVFAQSVGGGGGSGGFSGNFAFDANALLTNSKSISLGASLGGKGGGGGAADAVTVSNRGAIVTLGDGSRGIMAQSVGGGGGSGGSAVSFLSPIGTNTSKSVDLHASIGGDGGVGGHGSNVMVLNQGSIDTSGKNSHGISAQSVGGGGGDGGDVEVRTLDVDDILSLGKASGLSGVGPQPAGGTNGSQKTWNVDVSIGAGGSGGAAGEGGRVAVTNTGSILTRQAKSFGIFAQSIGGGGGAGGASATDTGSGGADTSIAVNFGIGGKGGAGGSAETVSILNQGAITTLGKASHGVVAQSIGGGGGVGGATVSTTGGASSDGLSVNLAAAIGGRGGVAGDGRNVAVVTEGTIETSGEGSYGILAQSIGGGGGDGGNAEVKTESEPQTNALPSPLADGDTNAASKSLSVDLSIGAGGLGAAGGRGGSVAVTNLGEILTRSNRSHGIYAQSIGGGGGTGGASVTDGGGGESDLAISASLSLGGKGGGGGSADEVIANNQMKITTLGNASHGIVAQSIGGGGGTGGASISTGAAGSSGSNNTVSLTATIGGAGAVAGHGSNVLVLNAGQVATAGQDSYGILAQSIGGGGGDGGNAEIKTGGGENNLATAGPLADGDTNETSKSWSVAVAVGLGGTAGAGGNGGEVVVMNNGSLITSNAQSHAIFAQSVGGGGGAGGASTTGTGGSDADLSVAVAVGLGGKGGAGGSANTVLVDNQSTVTTLGDASHGIAAQSIGGGGGMGGASAAKSAADNPGATVSLTATIGGRGGVGGRGSNVVVQSTGQIATAGQASYGILAQSVGGGGGSGGMSQGPDSASTNWSLSLQLGSQGGAGGQGGTVAITNIGSISTLGNDSHGALVQSIGGGGGNAGSAHSGEAQSWKDLNIAVGAQGGSGNDGGAVALANTGSITTHGDGSMGVVAQSIGGGGGVGSTAGMGASGRLGIGGSGGAAGDGNTVLVVQDGDIDTSGVAAQGIFAQSVGGGGGLAGNVDRGLSNLDDAGVGLGFAQDGGSAGHGGAVTVESTGDITTGGSGANGIFAQSVGGGGGLGGSVGPGITLDFAGSVGGSGSGGAVVLNHSGNIHTLGAAAHGIFAQSAGGSNGIGGTVQLSVTGDVIAEGVDSTGIFAQSTGLQGGSDIHIHVASGTVHGGSGSGVGVRIGGGANNTLVNHGTITTANGSSGRSIVATTGNDTVQNYGTIIGSVDLGTGHNVFNNYAGSTYDLIGSLVLGTGSRLDNTGLLKGSGSIVGDLFSTGTISPGNSAGSLSISGDLNLMAEAKVTLEIGGHQQGSSYDFIQVSSDAIFDGTLSLSLADNFRPTFSDAFTLMQFASLSGTFDNASNGARLTTADNLASFQVNYSHTNLVVSAFESPDTDGDGMSDYDESLAGTDRTNHDSVLAIKSVSRATAGQMVLQFAYVTNKNYIIEYSTNLSSGTWWSVPATNVTFPATNLCQWVDDYTLTGGAGSGIRLYRVRLKLQ